MCKRQSLLTLLLFCVSLASYSNPKLFPGYYVDLKGDTVRCNIEFNDWNLNPKTIHIEVGNGMKEFGPDDIRGFGVTGYNDYVSARIKFHNAPIKGTDLPSQFSDSVVQENRFLRILESGPYSLYELTLPQGNYLFDSRPDKPISELTYRVKVVNDTLQEDQAYKQQLVNLLMNEGLTEKYFDRVSKTPYKASQIAPLFRIMNSTRTGVWTKKKSKGDFQIEIFGGVIRNSFPTTFNGAYAKSIQFDPSYSPSGGVNFLYSIPGHFKAFKLGLSFSYSQYSGKVNQASSWYHAESGNYYYTVTYDETATIKSSLLRSNLYMMYLFNPLSELKVFAKAGVNYNFTLGSNKDVYTTFNANTDGIQNGNVPFQTEDDNSYALYSIKNSFVMPFLSAGIISGRSKFEFTYWFPVTISSESDALPSQILGNNSFKYGAMGIFYYFSMFPGNRR